MPENMTNIAKLLKDAPKGMKLYSPLFGEVEYMRLGDENKIWVKTSRGTYYFDKCGKPFAFDKAECLLFPSKNCRTWEGWELTSEPKFKVGDWVVIDNCHNSIYQVDSVCEHDYMLKHTHGGLMPCPFSGEKRLSLWTIADAKDGDVLVTTKIKSCPFIYRKTSYKNNLAYYYAGIDGNGNFSEGYLKRTLCHFGPVSDVTPATKEQHDRLFAKIKEAGYEWDADKKELRKIKPHYDIANFYAGMPVLVRADNVCRWDYSVFSRITGNEDWQFAVCNGVSVAQCIPFNADTKHLLGTTDMPSEEYINW